MNKKLLYQKTQNLLKEYLIQTIKTVKDKAKKGKGRAITGEVKNRPEDFETTIDLVGEEILERLIKKYKLPIQVFPEHNHSLGEKENPEIYGALDSFDGTKLYQKGFEHMWYTALSFYDKNSNPIMGGIADILNEKIYLGQDNKSYLFSLKDGKRKKISPSSSKNLAGNHTIASYLMSSQYFPKFVQYFGDLIKKMHPRTLLYPNGGSCIYAYLASGQVDAYIMFNEPRSEIDPGFALAKAAGCQVVEVHPDGSYKEYKFQPGRQHDKIKLLIATCTRGLQNKLIKHYKKNARKFFKP